MDGYRIFQDIMNIQKFDYFIINKIILTTVNGTRLIRSNKPKIVVEFNRVYILDADELRCFWFDVNKIKTIEIIYSENVCGEFFHKKELYKVS